MWDRKEVMVNCTTSPYLSLLQTVDEWFQSTDIWVMGPSGETTDNPSEVKNGAEV
jgi:hypothetical protein